VSAVSSTRAERARAERARAETAPAESASNERAPAKRAPSQTAPAARTPSLGGPLRQSLIGQNRSVTWFGPEGPVLWRRTRGFALLAAIAWGVVFSDPRPGVSGQRLAVTLLLAASLCSLGYAMFRREPQHRSVTIALLVGGVASVALTFATPHSPALALVAIAVARTALWWPMPWVVGYSAGIGVAYVVGHLAIGDDSGWIVGGAAVVVASLLGGLIRRQNDELASEVQQVREEQARSAALDERARIAREIHDVLAHSLAALSLQLDVADAMLESGRDEQARASVQRASRLAKEGMAETRRAVDALRTDTLPTPELLATIVDAYRQDTGALATLEVAGTARDLRPDVSLTLYRTAQEAITNVRKHMPGAAIKIDMRYERDAVELIVTNGPSAAGERPLTHSGGGYGLVGLRERAELAGGTFDAGPAGDGWRVSVRIPA
jgi:signal transduction histidine kinase